MNYLSLDYLIVYAFLFITLVIGLWAGRGVKDIRAYAIGNRKFGTAALVLTFLATEVGGQGTLNLAGKIGTTGIIVMVTFLSFSLSYIVQALWIAPRMVRFPQCMTMGDVMGTLYGRPSQVIVGIFSFITAICYVGAEIIMLGLATQSLLGIDARWGIIVGGLILTSYVVRGGITSVTTTDVMQFLVLLVLLPVLAATALEHAGGIKAVLTHIPQVQRSLWHHPQFSYYLVLFLSFGVFGMNMIDPALVQRMLMAQSAHQLRQMFLTLAGLSTALFLIFMLLGTTGHQLYPTLTAAEIVPHMIKELLPTGLRGLMIAGIIAVVIANADSYLHAARVTLVHDVLKPICAYRAVEINEIRWVRYTTLLAGLLIIGLGLAQGGKNLYGLIFAALEFTIPLLVFPFFTGILGLKPDQRTFYISAAVTLGTFFAGKLCLPEAVSHFLSIICVLASGCTFFAVHFIQNRGFVVVRRGTQATGAHLWQPRSQDLVAYLRNSIPTPQRIVQYSQQQVTKYGAPYILFGAFCCVNYTLPYFMWEHNTPGAYTLMLYLRVWGGLACGLLIVRDKWPQFLLPYLPTFWHLTLLYCLPFMSTVMFLLTQGSMEWLINVTLTIMFLIVLVDWLSFFLLSVLGVALGFFFYQWAIGPIDLHLDFSTGYLLVYTCLFSTIVALLFSGRKEQHLEAKLREIADHYDTIGQRRTYTHPATVRIATMIDHQVQEMITSYSLPIHAVSNVLQQDVSYTTIGCLHYFFPTAIAVIQQGEQMTKQLVEEIKANYIVPQKSLLSIQACVTFILEVYRTRHPQSIQVDLSEDYRIYTSFNHLQYALIHVLRFLQAHHLGDQVRLWITHKEGIHMRLSGQVLSPSLIHELCTLFPPKETAKHLGLAISRVLIEAQGGRLLYEINDLPQDPYTEFIITLPPAEESLLAP